MARKRDRIFAGLGALLFFGSACALTVAVIWQANQGGSTPPTTATTPTCSETSVAAAAETVPEVYKPTDAVTSLQTTDLIPGTGAAAKAGDCLQVKYYGTLTDGTKFDENYDQATALQFQLAANPEQVIPGWDQGLVGLKVGGTRRLVIPSTLAYGTQGSPPSIPANATLVFVVKLDKIGVN